MSRIKAAKSSAALLVAVIALVAALGGGAVAGVTISKLNNKEKKQVKRLSKKQAKKLDRRIELLPGPKGKPGQQGDPGVDGVSNYRVLDGRSGGYNSSWPNRDIKTLNSFCPIDSAYPAVVTGGVEPISARDGVDGGGAQHKDALTVVASHPRAGGRGWRTVIRNDSGVELTSWSLETRVICASVSP
jgi:hypothetical protein